MPDPPVTDPTANESLNMMASIPLGMIANTVESFSEKENIKFYFEKLEQRAKLDDWSEAQTLKLFKYRLAGQGIKFLKSDDTLDGLSYKELKKKFIKEFSPPVIPGEKLAQLNRMSQRHDESISNFVTRVKSLGAEILAEDLATAEAGEEAGIKRQIGRLMLNQVKVGLKKEILKDIGIACVQEKDLTLDRLIEIAQITELNHTIYKTRVSHAAESFKIESGPVEARQTFPNARLCFRCHKPGHFKRDCRVFIREQGTRQSGPDRRYPRDFGARGTPPQAPVHRENNATNNQQQEHLNWNAPRVEANARGWQQ